MLIGFDRLFALFQSTLSVRRATPCRSQSKIDAQISIHALREESDQMADSGYPIGIISIHALREESDGSLRYFLNLVLNFNPRSP